MVNTCFVITADQGIVGYTGGTSSCTDVTGEITNKTAANEAQSQLLIRDAGTFHNAQIHVTGNTTTSTYNFIFRKNTANGNQTVAIPSGTGYFADTTHTDATVATDKVDWAGSGGTSSTLSWVNMGMLFDSTTNFATRTATVSTTTKTYTSGSGFSGINGLLASASSETGIQTKMQTAGTMQWLQANLSANAKTSTMTFVSRKNTANGNMTMTIAASGTGIVEDTTHSDTIASADIWNKSFVAGTDTTNAATFVSTSADFITTNQKFIVQSSADADVAGTASSTLFAPLGGRLSFGSTEANSQTKALANFTYSNMTGHQTQSSTHAGTANFRKNTANANQTFSFGTAAGVYADTTHTDTTISTDIINYSATFGASTPGSFSKISVWGNFTATINQTVLVEWEE